MLISCKEVTTLIHVLLPQRAKTAFRAICDLRFAESFAARALPPFRPPSLPNATAAGFFSLPRFILDRLSLGMRYIECIIKAERVQSAIEVQNDFHGREG